ncbi:Heat shock protein 68 [Carabus blaptoides fortunei]
MGTPIAVGIDFGTSTSRIAVWEEGNVKIIANDQGDRTCPSYVAFTNVDRLIGDVAVHQIEVNPKNTIFDVKRIIGRKGTDSKLHEDMRFWPFKVINTETKIKLEVEHNEEVKRFAPEEISSMILSKLKSTAEAYLDAKVCDAVISVPAQFNDAQRRAVINAGKIAGFNVLQILNEPTAAALAYGLNNDIKGERHVLIYDLGGGNFDVSLVSIVNGSHFEVRATAGNAHLGGIDFDKRLANYLIEECKRKYQKDLRTNIPAVRRLRDAAEKAKCALSTNVEARIDIVGLTEDIDFLTTISRSRFERICADLFRATLQPVEQVLLDTKLNKASIDNLVLVGGSTRMPMIQFMLRKFFNGRTPNLCTNLNEPVVYGAAVQAAILTRDNSPTIKNLTLVDITAITIGYETHGCVMTNLIDRNTNKPCKKTRMFTTHTDSQDSIIVQVYEGESVVTKFNNFHGTFRLKEILPDMNSKPQIEATFDIDANGILEVSAKEVCTNNTQDLVVTNDIYRFTEEEINQMFEDAEFYRVQEQDKCESVVVRNHFQAFMYKTKQSAMNAGSKITEHEKIIMINCCDTELKWLEDNLEAEHEQYRVKLTEFKTLYREIMTKMHASGDASPTVEEH